MVKVGDRIKLAPSPHFVDSFIFWENSVVIDVDRNRQTFSIKSKTGVIARDLPMRDIGISFIRLPKSKVTIQLRNGKIYE